MPALNLGYLLGAANRSLTGARQGTRERQEMERQMEIEDSTRMFNEWAKRNQMEFQNRQLDEGTRMRQATIDNTRAISDNRVAQDDRDAAMRKYIADQVEKGRQGRFEGAGATPVQDFKGEYQIPRKNQIGPTGIVAPLPESRDGMSAPGKAPGQRIIPSGMADKIAGVEGVIKQAETAQAKLADAIQKKINISGPLMGRGGSMLREAFGQAPPEAIELNSILASIGSRELLARSGAAVTPSEYDRVRPFIPNNNDPEEVMLDKLKSFTREVKIMQQERMASLDNAGYNMSGYKADADEALANRFLQTRKKKP